MPWTSSTPAATRPLLWRMCLLNGLALGSYGVVAPTAQSLFLGAFDAASMPYAWLVVMVAALAATACLRLLVRRVSLPACFAGVALANAAFLAAMLALVARGSLRASFAVYVWRDVYILVLLEMLWMMANLSPLAARAHQLYGWVSAAGTAGTVATSLAAGALVARVGTRPLLWAMVPCLAAIGLLALTPGLAGAARPPSAAAAPGGGRRLAGAGLAGELWPIFAVVAAGHVCLTLLDFQVNSQVQAQVPDQDARTRLMSYLHSATNLLSVLLQLGSARLMRRLSVAGALLVSPVALLVGLGLQATVGGLAPLLGAKLMVKGADHSLYRIGKESLYLPLSFRAKTDGKASIDIAGSRAAKGLASVLILWLLHARRQDWVGALGLVFALLWAAACALQWRRGAARARPGGGRGP